MPDHRTTALLTGSVAALTALGVWARCQDQAAPLRVMRIVDDTARLLRAPEVSFDAAEIGLDAFGHNIANRHLLAALVGRAQELAALSLVPASAASVEFGDDRIVVRCDDGTTVTARLAVGADGRRSVCRAAAGIDIDRHSYPQAALSLQRRPCKAASRHLDRIPHRGWPVHAGAAARPAFEPGMGNATG